MSNENPVPADNPPQIRVSDAEREHTASALRQAADEGRLTLDELDERLGVAYAARFQPELDPLTADLPKPAAPEGPADPPARRGWQQLPTPFVVHVAIVTVLAVTLLVRWAVSEAPWFWPAGPLFWLAVSVFVHARIRGIGFGGADRTRGRRAGISTEHGPVDRAGQAPRTATS